MAIEKEILARIQEAIDTGNLDNEQLYKAFLGDLTYKKSQGMPDSERLLTVEAAKLVHRRVVLPEIREQRSQFLVDQLKPLFADFDDTVDTGTLYGVFLEPKGERVFSSFTSGERNLLTKAFTGLGRGRMSLGEFRTLSYDEVLGIRLIGEKSGPILMHTLQRAQEPSDA